MKYKTYLLETELQFSKEERNAFLESLKKITEFKSHIFRETNEINPRTKQPISFAQKLETIKTELGNLIETAESFTLGETQRGFKFDAITINRDLKTIRENYKMFEKTCNEMQSLQQRLESCYENIGTGLGRYYEI